MSISGAATKEGTTRFMERFPQALENSSYRRYRKMRISSVGIGTYLGAPGDAEDRAYAETIERALRLGSNLIDTAIVYRDMRSERVVGQTLSKLIESGDFKRDEIIVCTKGGYLPFDSSSAFASADDYRQHRFGASSLVEPQDLDLRHSLSPDFLWNQIESSIANLGLDTIDLYYLHNPETQLGVRRPEDFYPRLTRAFELLERAVREGKIQSYGLATWQGFRVDDSDRQFLSLPQVLKCVESAAGSIANFGGVQLPLNLSKTEAVSMNKQSVPGKPTKISFSMAATEYRVPIFASATLDQGKLTKYIPPVVKQHFQRLSSDAQVAVQFARSCPGVTTALVGMKTLAHVEDILGLFRYQPESPENFVRLFESPERSIIR